MVTVGPGAQHPVEHALGPAPRLERRHQLLRVPAGKRRGRVLEVALHQAADHEVVERVDVGVGALAGRDAGQPQQRLPLGRHRRVGPSTAGE